MKWRNDWISSFYQECHKKFWVRKKIYCQFLFFLISQSSGHPDPHSDDNNWIYNKMFLNSHQHYRYLWNILSFKFSNDSPNRSKFLETLSRADGVYQDEGMPFAYGKSLHCRKLMRPRCVRNLKRANIFVAADHLEIMPHFHFLFVRNFFPEHTSHHEHSCGSHQFPFSLFSFSFFPFSFASLSGLDASHVTFCHFSPLNLKEIHCRMNYSRTESHIVLRERWSTYRSTIYVSHWYRVNQTVM